VAETVTVLSQSFRVGEKLRGRYLQIGEDEAARLGGPRPNRFPRPSGWPP
jgi:hypothetical protein